MSKGLIHVYTGDGKGKTTAAFGLAIRAAGHGKKVLILQFLKSRTKDAGERAIAKKSGIKVVKFKGQTTPLFDPTVKRSELKRHIQEALAFTGEQIKSGEYDLIILDEFNNLFRDRYADTEDIYKLTEEQPRGLELVFTGRGAPKELIEIADYVTEMRMIKHPAVNGLKARKGIEF
ncbi:MAG: cob(I)yrinic acid a,c-diamide adenosyltransferase [Nitrospirae bacterium]|nr:cob(I)yrinic acid a,c-diamide adenosyltransferase [Nitrospirota bacterium]